MTVCMTWLAEEEKEAIYGEALGVLERVGMRFSGSKALPALEEAGARVDRATGVVRFPAELVEGALEACPRDVLMAGARAEKDVLLDGGKSFFNVSGCAAKTLDRNQGDLRPSTLTDLASWAPALAHAGYPTIAARWTTSVTSFIASASVEVFRTSPLMKRRWGNASRARMDSPPNQRSSRTVTCSPRASNSETRAEPM